MGKVLGAASQARPEAGKGEECAHVEILPGEDMRKECVPTPDLSGRRLFVGRPKASRPSFWIVAILWILPVLRPITNREPVHLAAACRDRGSGVVPGIAGYKDGDMIRSCLRWLSVVAVTLVGASGCCVNRFGEPVPDGAGFMSGLHLLRGQRCSSCGPTTFAEKSACRTGCGEIYWDEWLSDPPDCCDPCDDCGNWVGPQHGCRKRPSGGLWSLIWGCRGETCSDGECCDEGCVGGCERCDEVVCGIEPSGCIDRAVAHLPPDVEEMKSPAAAQPTRPSPPTPPRAVPGAQRMAPPSTPSAPGPLTTRSAKPAPSARSPVRTATPPQKRTARTPSRFPARPVGHVE